MPTGFDSNNATKTSRARGVTYLQTDGRRIHLRCWKFASSAATEDEVATTRPNFSSRSRCQGRIRWASAAASACDRHAETQPADEDWPVANLDPTTKIQVFHLRISTTTAKFHKIITIIYTDTRIFTCLDSRVHKKLKWRTGKTRLCTR